MDFIALPLAGVGWVGHGSVSTSKITGLEPKTDPRKFSDLNISWACTLHQKPICGDSLEQGRWDPCPQESYSLVEKTDVKEADNYIRAQVL